MTSCCGRYVCSTAQPSSDTDRHDRVVRRHRSNSPQDIGPTLVCGTLSRSCSTTSVKSGHCDTPYIHTHRIYYYTLITYNSAFACLVSWRVPLCDARGDEMFTLPRVGSFTRAADKRRLFHCRFSTSISERYQHIKDGTTLQLHPPHTLIHS